METDAKDATKDASGKDAPKEAPAKEKKKRVKKTSVPFQASHVAGYSAQQLNAMFEREHQMQVRARHIFKCD